MSDKQYSLPCPDCDGVSRRDFLKGVGSAAVVAAAGAPVFAVAREAAAAASSGSQESMAAALYSTMSAEQKKAVCFGWEHPRRQMVGNNWRIVPQTIGEFYTPAQQEMIMGIFKSAHSEEWVERRLKQLQDDGGGIKNYNIAMFGAPGSGKFEWVMTGRHLTLRVDGDSEPGVAFGGPHFYGHAAHGFNEAADHPDNVYWYQAKRANEVFKALSGKQREIALINNAVPAEAGSTLLSHPKSARAGLAVEAMSKDQQELVSRVMSDLLAPFNKRDVAEAEKYIEKNGGAKSLNLSFYSQEDVGKDGVWDVWMLQGPTMAWYFRGAPHVHTWVWISEKPLTAPPLGPTEG